MNNNLLSVILLSYYSGSRLHNVFTRLKSILNDADIPFELVIIDDGSQDESFSMALKLEDENENVRAYQLSKNYTSHYAIFAGLTKVAGACATVIPDDEQQPYEIIVEMYRAWKQEHKVIIPFRNQRNDSFINKLFSGFFYSIINNLSVIQMPKGGADTFFIDREIINIINKDISPINTTSITEVLRLGFSPYFLPYVREIGTNNKSRWTWKKKFRLAADFFFSSSNFPIKMITFIGFFFSTISFLLIFFYIYIKLFGDPDFWNLDVPGWTSLIVVISFFCGLILLSIGIVAEYIWRIYEEVKNRPGFIIRKKE